jgi:hypothetical protein
MDLCGLRRRKKLACKSRASGRREEERSWGKREAVFNPAKGYPFLYPHGAWLNSSLTEPPKPGLPRMCLTDSPLPPSASCMPGWAPANAGLAFPQMASLFSRGRISGRRQFLPCFRAPPPDQLQLFFGSRTTAAPAPQPPSLPATLLWLSDIHTQGSGTASQPVNGYDGSKISPFLVPAEGNSIPAAGRSRIRWQSAADLTPGRFFAWKTIVSRWRGAFSRLVLSEWPLTGRWARFWHRIGTDPPGASLF